MSNEVLSRQEMFRRAWEGLKSQGWKRAIDSCGCVYKTEDGRRCAWGWVDPENTQGVNGSVRALHERRIGIAANLSGDVLKFASSLQSFHDLASESLEEAMRAFADRHGLTIPGEGE